MSRRRRYPRVISPEREAEIREQATRAVENYASELAELQAELLEWLDEMGPQRFTEFLANVLLGQVRHAIELNPDNRPDLRGRLHELQSAGYLVDGLRAYRIGPSFAQPDLRFELPLDTDLKDYLPAMLAYQAHLQSLEGPQRMKRYLADEHGEDDRRPGRTYDDLADELNEGVRDWVEGRRTKLDALGLDAFMRDQGFTREDLQAKPGDVELGIFTGEMVRRIVRYYMTGK